MSSHNTHELKNPGTFSISLGLRGLLLALVAIGVVSFFMEYQSNPTRAWAAFLLNHFYFMALAIGGLFFAAVQWVTGAMWSAPVRRIAESFATYLPVSLVTGAVLYFGIHDLYSWSHPEYVKGDLILEGKSGYLSVGFFMARNLIAIAVWWMFSKKMIGNSIKQDVDKGNQSWTLKNRFWAPIFLIIFALTFTMASFDLMMSIDAHWFSTMFGVYCFAGMFYTTLALLGILMVCFKRSGLLKDFINSNHIHDIGKFMFAFTVFYAYIGFCQFMLIWYANLPEEVGYYTLRFTGPWLWVSIFLLAGKFAIPFFVLLPRDSKRNESLIWKMGVYMLCAHWVDLMWIVQPEYNKSGPVFGLPELGVTAGFIGLFGLAISHFWSRHNMVAIGDPRLEESVFHHHQ